MYEEEIAILKKKLSDAMLKEGRRRLASTSWSGTDIHSDAFTEEDKLNEPLAKAIMLGK